MRKVLPFCLMFFVSTFLFAQNMLSNPGFENWTINGASGPPDDWELTATQITAQQESSTIHSESYSANITWTTTSTCHLEQVVSVSPNLEYTFSSWFFDNDPDGRTRLTLRWETIDGTYISNNYSDYTEDSTNWQQLSVTATAPSDAQQARLRISVYDISGWDGDATIYADDVSFEGGSTNPIITVISPNGDEQWEQGSTQDITWTSLNFTGNIKIELEVGYNRTREILIASTEDDGIWEWQIPTNQTINNSYLIIVSNADGVEPWDESNEPFSIIEPIPAIPLTIYEIQYTTEPGGASPYEGERVETSGVVTAVFENSFFIQDGSGAWNGINIYPLESVSLGDDIILNGDVLEYYGKTEITDIISLQISGTSDLPEPVTISTNDLTNSESYEGVLVKVEDVTVTNDDLGNGEWEIDDGSGPCRVDDLGTYTYVPALDDFIYSITGVVDYTYGSFKLEPRYDDDFVFENAIDNPVCSSVQLLGNYPNPFNPSTTIYFETTNLHENSRIEIYNIKGQKVRQFSDIRSQTSVVWDGKDENNFPVGSGIYFYKLKAGNFEKIEKMILMK